MNLLEILYLFSILNNFLLPVVEGKLKTDLSDEITKYYSDIDFTLTNDALKVNFIHF